MGDVILTVWHVGECEWWVLHVTAATRRRWSAVDALCGVHRARRRSIDCPCTSSGTDWRTTLRNSRRHWGRITMHWRHTRHLANEINNQSIKQTDRQTDWRTDGPHCVTVGGTEAASRCTGDTRAACRMKSTINLSIHSIHSQAAETCPNIGYYAHHWPF